MRTRMSVGDTLRLAVLALTAFLPACGPDASEVVLDETSLETQSVINCGAKYQPALRKYELAVLAAKRVVASQVCELVRNPRDGQAVEASFEAVGELMQESIALCGSFRATFNDSPYAEPVRQALKNSLLAEVISGRLDTTRFTAIATALVNKRLYGIKPGVANVSRVTFRAQGVLQFEVWNPETGKMDLLDGTGWSVQRQGNRLVIRIDIVDGSTFLVPTYDGKHVKLVPTDPRLVLSTSSDPCSA